MERCEDCGLELTDEQALRNDGLCYLCIDLRMGALDDDVAELARLEQSRWTTQRNGGQRDTD
jgi:hypothetical protein